VRDFMLSLLRLPRSLYLLGATTLVVVLFWGGSQPFAVGLFPPPYDKVAHSVYFAALAVLFWFASGGKWPVFLVLAVSAIGGLDELHQRSLPGRSADFYDYLTDTVAAGLAIMLLERYKAAVVALRGRTS
jgi:VanZ like family